MKIYRPLINAYNILDTNQKLVRIKSDITNPDSNTTKPLSDLLGDMRKKLAKMPDVDTDRVEKIKTELSQKEFKVDTAELAKTIIDFHKKAK